MGSVFFYHLTRSPLETALPLILTRALQAGWRVAVRGRDRARMEWLDERLWLVPPDGFLPHGLAGGPHDGLQPVLLTADSTPRPGIACLVTIDGAEVMAEEAAGLERVCVVFDGNDETAKAEARGTWRAMTGAGLAAQYWSEEGGRWEKKSEAAARA